MSKKGIKLAISGKGGVGKTTLAAALAKVYVDRGKDVLAVDADPDANFAQALGFPDPNSITPICKMKSLIYERTETTGEGYGAFFKLNPHVSDLPEEFSHTSAGVRFMVLGTIYEGGKGCACPENVFLRTLLDHLVLQRDEVVIVDLEAGVEHLGRATARATDAMIVVVEPGLRSLTTAARVRELAADVGIKRIYMVANKVRDDREKAFIERHLGDIPLLGMMSFDEAIAESDRTGMAVFDGNDRLLAEVQHIGETLDELLQSG